MIKSKFFFVILAFILIAGFTSLSGQEQGGEIVGTVFLPDGTSIPGVAVEATSTKLIGKRVVVTNENGKYRFPVLPSGKYLIKFKLEGFKLKVNKNVLVILGKIIKIDAIMETGDIKTEIIVIGNTPTIDVRKSSSAENITKDIISKLPKGRSFLSVITKGSGVNYEKNFDNDASDKFDDGSRGNTGISFDGASSSENTFFVDGVDTTTLYTGDSGARVNVDFIEEVQVKSSGYAAEYGGSMGGVISVITKSGGNEFHGSLNFDYSGDMLDGGWGKTLRLSPFDSSVAEYVSYKEDTWNELQPGLSFGGYIIKDKLWFFGAFQPRFTKRTRPAANIEAEGFSGDYEQTRTTLAGSLKITGQIANNLRLSLSGSIDNYKYEGDLPALDGSSNPEKEFEIYGWEYPASTMGGSLDYTLGNNLLISATGGYYKSDRVQAVGPDGPRYFHINTNAGVPGATNVVPNGWANYGYYDGYQVERDINEKLTGSLNTTYYADMFGGEHVLKAGIQFSRVGVDKSDAYPYDYNRFYWGDDYQSPNLGLVPTTLGYVQVRDPFGVVADVQSTRWAIYLQDSWTIGNRFTFNIGLRAEKEDIPAFAEGYDPPVKFGFADKLAPRLGFAWDILGDSTLKVFGSFGVYYDVMKLEMAEGSYGGFKWISSYYDLVDADWEKLLESDHPVVGGFGGGEFYETIDWRVPSYDTTQPDMKPYQKNEFSFGMEKKLKENLSVSVKFLHNYIVNAIEDIGIQEADGEHYYNGNPGSEWIQDIYDESAALGVIPVGVKASLPVRKYTSFTFNVDKRFSNNWLGGVSYTMSWLYGNFAGLASSDELGRQSPGVERYYDAWFMTFTEDGEEELGYLMTDRRHQLKFYGAYSFDFGLTLGVNGFVMSGTPVQKEVYLNGMQGWYPEGRASEGRTPLLWQLDVYAEHIFKLSEKYSVALSLNVANITNNQIAQRIHGLYNRSVVYADDQLILDGFDATQEVLDSGATLDPRYLKETSFQSTFAARIGIKLMF